MSENAINTQDLIDDNSKDEIIPNGGYRFSDKIYQDYPVNMNNFSSNNITTNTFEKLPHLFTDEKPDDGFEYVQIYGRLDNKRCYKWFRKDYLKSYINFDKYKVIIPQSNGSGAIGEVLSTPIIGYTDTFLGIGCFDNRLEAENCLKYIKSKFARTMLGVLKVTQHNSRPTWAKVPLQDFTEHSDIDWTKSIDEIDKQLYKKYGLSDDEIAFIESKVRAMD